MTMLPNLHAKMTWDILRDFEPVSLVATIEWGLVAEQRRAVQERGRPDRRGQGAPRQGQLRLRRQRQPAAHRDGALRLAAPASRMTHVPYKGAIAGRARRRGGRRAGALPGSRAPSRGAGPRRRRCGSSASRRPRRCRSSPTRRRSPNPGLPGFEFNSWFAVMAPAGTPKEIIARLQRGVAKALADPDVREKLIDQGLTPRGATPESWVRPREQLARSGS